MPMEKKSRFLTNPVHQPGPTTSADYDDDKVEFDESDVIWSSSSTEDTTTTASTAATTVAAASQRPYHLSPSAGLSAALISGEEPGHSPTMTSIKRKTTSSPIAMISSSSLLRSPDYGRKIYQSAPVNVPVWPKGNAVRRRRQVLLGPFDEINGEDDEEFEDDEEMVPPHEIVARSQRTTTFSVIEGAGRTLKGRDLTRVRNAVFQKTGFLE